MFWFDVVGVSWTLPKLSFGPSTFVTLAKFLDNPNEEHQPSWKTSSQLVALHFFEKIMFISKL